jgi:hypothetical protein
MVKKLFNKGIKLFAGKKAKPVSESLPINWHQNYPWFNLEITTSGYYKLNNKTGYLADGLITREYQRECLTKFNKKNISEGGKAVKRVAMVLCKDASEYELYKFTNGWVPSQDIKDKDGNISTAYLIEYKDGTNTGWLRWSSNRTTMGSLYEINILLHLFANATSFQYRTCARDARSKHMATLNQNIK